MEGSAIDKAVNRNMSIPGASSGGKTSRVNGPILPLGVDQVSGDFLFLINRRSASSTLPPRRPNVNCNSEMYL